MNTQARVEKENEKEAKISREQLRKLNEERAKEVATNRLLTQEEHEKIRIENAMQHVVDVRRNVTTTLDKAENSSNVVSMKKIETVTSRRVSFCLFSIIFCFKTLLQKHDYESRMATVLAGREDRGEYGKARRKAL